MIVAIILIGILVMIWYSGYETVSLFICGIVAGILLTSKPIAGGTKQRSGLPDRCDEEGAGLAYARGRRGHKMESLMQHFLNCNVATGTFHEVQGQNRELDWLWTPDESAPDGRVYLDLDAYNPEAKVAFEFNGPIHYRCVEPIGSKEWRRWLVSRYNDTLKADICAANNVKLIVIDFTTLDEDYIRSRLWDVGALHPRMMNSTGAHKDFTYIDAAKPPPRDYADEIKNIKSVKRFGEDAPIISFAA